MSRQWAPNNEFTARTAQSDLVAFPPSRRQAKFEDRAEFPTAGTFLWQSGNPIN